MNVESLHDQVDDFDEELLDNYVRSNVKSFLEMQGRDIDVFDLSWEREGLNISVNIAPKIEKVEISCNLSIDTRPEP